MKLHCILFDLDGTLLDSLPDIAAATNRMRVLYGLAPLPEARIRTMIGDGIGELVKRAVAGDPVDPVEATEHMRRFYMAHLTEGTRLYPGVAAGLAELTRRGISCGVVTNKPQAASEAILAKLGIRHFFGGVIGGGAGFELKPSPAGCLALAAQCGVAPSAVAMVGDHWTDLAAARGAGMTGILAGWGYGDPRGEPFVYRAADFTDLMHYLTTSEGE